MPDKLPPNTKYTTHTHSHTHTHTHTHTLTFNQNNTVGLSRVLPIPIHTYPNLISNNARNPRNIPEISPSRLSTSYLSITLYTQKPDPYTLTNNNDEKKKNRMLDGPFLHSLVFPSAPTASALSTAQQRRAKYDSFRFALALYFVCSEANLHVRAIKFALQARAQFSRSRARAEPPAL